MSDRDRSNSAKQRNMENDTDCNKQFKDHRSGTGSNKLGLRLRKKAISNVICKTENGDYGDSYYNLQSQFFEDGTLGENILDRNSCRSNTIYNHNNENNPQSLDDKYYYTEINEDFSQADDKHRMSRLHTCSTDGRKISEVSKEESFNEEENQNRIEKEV
eukprot:CAMPEP_0170539144 /NCGR_PEP_ID=MMETSP0209-20121228/103741_1 /TAXON_ID=665100 ORGANISM="Litonotus pictus, Strain P1" /NCGR_SAMPLE_ID=MMETSP0209 /ASSEMBLY_ACC=CAM_ASM_000301 /LENGTH=159 /DNA_ID=CAMNT_0010840989 /DNA_START=2179 /DNA_END=2659 /DNA_ORIENTATION=-